jgi:hypothetical protein
MIINKIMIFIGECENWITMIWLLF